MNQSNNKNDPKALREIEGWSWGGFLLTWIWAIGNGVWIGLLALIPIVNIVMAFVLALKGREWAWKAKKWESVEQFKHTQKVWAIVGFVLIGLQILLIPIIIVLIRVYVFLPFYVNGNSMNPTYHNNDYLIVSELAKKDPPERGSVVVFHYQGNTVFIKRVVGLPGDRVVIKGGKLTVYNTEHPEGYDPLPGYGVNDANIQGNLDQVVSKGSVFVLGDNMAPGASFDSRSYGAVPFSDIIGVVQTQLTSGN